MRTDRTSVCVSCRLRFSPAPRCPVCDRDGTVHDLRRADEVERAADLLVRRRVRRGGGGWIGLDSVRARTSGWQRRLVVGAVVIAFVFGSPWLAARVLRVSPTLLAMIGVAIAFLWVVGRAVRAALRARGSAPMQLQIAEPEPRPPNAAAEKIRGRVRALGSFESPVAGTACVAARLVGDTFGGVVDDARAVTFELVPDGGGDEDAYRVELGEATVDIGVPTEPSAVESNVRLTAFLSRRGLFPTMGPIVVAEGVLCHGDRVEVDGLVAEVPKDETYRTVGHVRVLRERPEAPLVLRKV